MVLVLLDLPSGYIFVESQATARDYQTWQERVQQALVRLPVSSISSDPGTSETGFGGIRLSLDS